MKYIWAIVGTKSERRYKVMRKRTEPQIGDKLMLRDFEAWQDESVLVREIKTWGNHVVYYCEKM